MQAARILLIQVEKWKKNQNYQVWVIGIGFESFDDTNTLLGMKWSVGMSSMFLGWCIEDATWYFSKMPCHIAAAVKKALVNV